MDQAAGSPAASASGSEIAAAWEPAAIVVKEDDLAYAPVGQSWTELRTLSSAALLQRLMADGGWDALKRASLSDWGMFVVKGEWHFAGADPGDDCETIVPSSCAPLAIAVRGHCSGTKLCMLVQRYEAVQLLQRLGEWHASPMMRRSARPHWLLCFVPLIPPWLRCWRRCLHVLYLPTSSSYPCDAVIVPPDTCPEAPVLLLAFGETDPREDECLDRLLGYFMPAPPPTASTAPATHLTARTRAPEEFGGLVDMVKATHPTRAVVVAYCWLGRFSTASVGRTVIGGSSGGAVAAVGDGSSVGAGAASGARLTKKEQLLMLADAAGVSSCVVDQDALEARLKVRIKVPTTYSAICHSLTC